MPCYNFIPDPYLPTDRQTLLPVAACGLCRDELYAGEVCYRIDGQLICESCLAAYAHACFAGCRYRLCLPPPETSR